ncbi:IclR family transcriptional regulator [Herbiconiux sp. P15]|uniref:IclR family transcriptional regulator n=1 Tax=Herbiconiux liukaitaii TaxID=3342799 RepID=UPI0035B9A28B
MPGSESPPASTRVSGAASSRVKAGSGLGSESSRKVLSVLLSFSEENHTQTVQEIAGYLDVPVSSAYRYVAQLRDFGLLEEAEFGGYRVSLRAVGLARAARAGSAGLSEIARPVLERLTRETGETSLVIRRLGQAVVAVDLEESRNPVRLRFERGVLMSLHQGAAARVLLAALSPRESAEYYKSVWNIEENPSLPSDAELKQIAADGWTESFGQVEDGIWGTAAVIRVNRTVVAALCVAGPLYRLDDAKRATIIAAVRRGADEINEIAAQGEF